MKIVLLYICGGVNKFLFCILGVKIGAKKCPIFLPTKSDRIFGQSAYQILHMHTRGKNWGQKVSIFLPTKSDRIFGQFR
jgi:hypothetical protein